MRISSALVHQQATEQLGRLGTQASETQQRIASGQRLLTPSDDPVAAARILELDQDLAVRGQYLRNADLAQSKLQAQDSVITQVVDSLQRVRELTLQAGGGALTPQDRGFIAAELDARLDELLSLLNSRGADGNFLFSGFQGDQEPFAEVAGQLTFVGDQGEQRIQIDRSASVAVGISGFRLFDNVAAAEVVPFVQVPESNSSDAQLAAAVSDQARLNEFSPDNVVVAFSSDPVSGELLVSATRASDGRVIDGVLNQPFSNQLALPSAGLDLQFNTTPAPNDSFLVDSSPKRGLLGTAQEVAAQLQNPISTANSDNSGLRDLLDTTLVELDNSLNTILGVQAEIGAQQNRVESTAELHRTVEIQGRQALSSLRDVDFAQAVSDLSFQSFLLEAAQQSFIRINNLSLFNAL